MEGREEEREENLLGHRRERIEFQHCKFKDISNLRGKREGR